MRITPAAWTAALASLTFTAVACHNNPAPQTAVAPVVDSAALERARQDSIARAEAEAREREAQARLERQRIADSVAAAQRASQQMQTVLTTMVHFDYDRSQIRPGDAQVLDLKIPILQANPEVRLQVAGNCDERGSDEYNLALGNRRAMAVRTYLASHGIDASRLELVSYGEERPVDPGHNETAWAMNRNGQFSLLNPQVALRMP